jgi:peptide deformylase
LPDRLVKSKRALNRWRTASVAGAMGGFLLVHRRPAGGGRGANAGLVLSGSGRRSGCAGSGGLRGQRAWPLAGRASMRGPPAIDPTGGAAYVSSMATRPIITLPDPLLRKRSAPIERIDADVGKLADDMLETMYAAPGVGLAAVQVGVPRRLIVVDVAKDEEEPTPLIMINPEILSFGPDLRLHEEGCLSIPDERIEIERPGRLAVRYLDRNGKPHELAAEGLLATVIQHEIDHLNGKLIIDYLSRLKRDIIIRRFKKLAKAGAGA